MSQLFSASHHFEMNILADGTTANISALGTWDSSTFSHYFLTY